MPAKPGVIMDFRKLKLKTNRRKGARWDTELLEKCAGFFDLDHYRLVSSQPLLSEDAGLIHYLETGWHEGFDPSLRFSTKAYLELHPDVANEGINPLLHYVMFGIHENRIISKKDSEYIGKIEKLRPTGVEGWAFDVEAPNRLFDFTLLIDGYPYQTIRNGIARPDLRKSGLASDIAGFSLNIPFHMLPSGDHLIEIELPNGVRFKKNIDIINSKDEALRYFSPRLTALSSSVVKIVVPIFNAIDDLRICVERLRDHTSCAEVILIDDCSTDPEIGKFLATLESEPMFRALRNDSNLGFTKTVNRGLSEAGDADVVILNSDARVTPRWLEGMHAAAYSQEKVATVTAMSDRAGAFSAPDMGNENTLPPGVDEIDFARAFRRRSLKLYPEVPTGNGFCMYIRRQAIDALGALDEAAFPRGYGEENDFCMRALRAGWKNLVDDSTYVFHDRSKSFGDEKTENIARGRAVVDERYPEYKPLIDVFRSGPAMNMARYRSRLALLDCTSGHGIQPRALFVVSTQTGGTPQTNADLMEALQETFECFVMRCDSRIVELSRHREGETEILKTFTLTQPIEPLTHRSSEYDAVVAQWLDELDLDIVHIRHLGWHSLTLPELAKSSGARVVLSFHDFYALCPSLKLLDEANVFCGGACTPGQSNCNVELWPSARIPSLKNGWVHHWRAQMARALAFCDAFVTTSPSAKERIAKALPDLPETRFHVIPHGRDFGRFLNLHLLPNGDGPVRILVPGNINQAKGLDLLIQVLQLDTLGEFEFHILGGVHLAALGGSRPSRLHLHDRYNRSDFASKVQQIAPHLGAVFSIWDETYCHTLTEMWSIGLPVAVLDFPTLRRRMEDSGAGWVLEDMEPQAVLDRLRQITSDRAELAEKGAAATRWQSRRGAAQSTRQMASRYLDVYRGSAVGETRPKIGVACPGSRRLNSAYPSTEIRVWERTRNRLDRPVDYIRSTPNALIAKMQMGMISGAILQRNVLPAALVGPFLETARETQTPYIFELDDQLLAVPQAIDTTRFYSAYAPHIEALIRNAAAVTVSTTPLAEGLCHLNPAIHVIENRISARLWSGSARAPDASGPLRLLYMGGTSHGEDLAFALEAIAIARQKLIDLRLTMIGVTTKDDALPDWVDVIEVPKPQRSYSLFVPWLREVADTGMLGIAPLIDNEFNRYKSNLKVLDYGALGLPVIASKVESFRGFEGSGALPGVSLLPNDANVWASMIVERMRQPKQRRIDGEALKQWVFANRRVEDDLERYDALILQYLGGGTCGAPSKQEIE